jgi:hypothetical protein
MDFDHRGVKWEKMKEIYKANGIEAIWLPIEDFEAESFKKGILEGAKLLQKML